QRERRPGKASVRVLVPASPEPANRCSNRGSDTPVGPRQRGEREVTDLKDRPLVSVVIPMLDEVDHIDACLDGFAAQTYPLTHLELLVVDGGSTDGSRERVEKRMAEQPWLRIIDTPARRASAAFNRGAESASGQVVCL